MSQQFFTILLFTLWGLTVVVFFIYFLGRKKRYQHVIEDFLAKHDQVFLALQKSEERFQKLITNMNEGLIFTDEQDKIKFINKCACAILKTSSEKILNRTFTDLLLSPSDARKLGLPYELKRHGCSHREEIQLVRQNGEMFWANLNISYLDTLQDHMPGSIIVMTDITEKKMMEEKLHNITLNLNQRVKQLDCLTEISEIQHMPGMDLQAIMEKTLKIIPQALKNQEDAWIEIIIGNERFLSKNFRESKLFYQVAIKGSKKKFGTLRVGYKEDKYNISEAFHINEKILIKNVAEKLAQILELDELQQSLKEGYRKLNELQEITGIGYWEWQLDQKKSVTYSDRFFDIMEVDPHNRPGYNPDIFYKQIHPDDLAYMQSYVERIKSGITKDLVFSYRIIPKQGKVKHILGYGKLIKDKSGNPIKLIGTVQDATSQIERFKEIK